MSESVIGQESLAALEAPAFKEDAAPLDLYPLTIFGPSPDLERPAGSFHIPQEGIEHSLIGGPRSSGTHRASDR